MKAIQTNTNTPAIEIAKTHVLAQAQTNSIELKIYLRPFFCFQLVSENLDSRFNIGGRKEIKNGIPPNLLE